MKKLLSIIAFLVIVGIITVGIVLYAQGYRPNFKEKSIEATGIVSIKSTPNQARVFIDGEEKGTTNIDIPDLKPGKYTIKIVKEGFSNWEKNVDVTKENVNLIQALLFPVAPSLRALTFTGVNNPLVSPNGKGIVFSLKEPEEKAGIWALNFSTSPLPSFFTKDLTQVAADTEEIIFSESSWEFSPDGKQLLVKLPKSQRYFALDLSKENGSPKEATLDVVKIKTRWEDQANRAIKANLKGFDKKAQLLAASLSGIKFSPDKTKFLGRKGNGIVVLYNSNLGPAPNQEAQIYNLPAASNYLWYPDSEHVMLVKTGSISIIDGDGENNITVYTGDFDPALVAPWPDGSKIVISTNLNTTVSQLSNLYAIELR
ncbi:MAG TPA: PEGA domain-containing protein [Candidatus Nanoarchaeia archaeon]